MKNIFALLALLLFLPITGETQDDVSTSLYEVPPLWLVDVPTAGTLPRGHFQIGSRFYPGGGAIGFTDIGLSNRFMIGVSYGAADIISSNHPDWNPRIEFHVRFRVIDEMEMFPAITAGFSSQGFGAWNATYDRYQFKSRGFFASVSRSFYFYQWTAGWHVGVNYSLENDVDHDEDLNIFLGLDATFKYNLALLLEWDAATNDDGSSDDFSGKGRGYLNLSVKWLFARNLQIEALAKDMFINRPNTETFTRELRLTYIDRF